MVAFPDGKFSRFAKLSLFEGVVGFDDGALFEAVVGCGGNGLERPDMGGVGRRVAADMLERVFTGAGFWELEL